MPENIKQAVVAAEDQSFWTNKGIDPKGIIRAAFSNARGNSTQGASTITQQYVKILYLTQERSLKRKLKEAFLSLKLQREQSKQQILEGYLNTIYFGRGAYGIQAAAKAYFDVDAKDLNLKQSAVLASVLNDPNDLDPSEGKDAKAALKDRYTYVLDSMAEHRRHQRRRRRRRPARRCRSSPRSRRTASTAARRATCSSLVRNELRQMGYSEEEIDGGGLRVTTTFTPEAMKAAEEGVLSQKPEGFGDKELHIAAATVEPGTGALLGFYGGQDYLDSEINWAERRRHGRLDVQADHAGRRDRGRLLPGGHLPGHSPYTFPDGLEVNNEGENGGNDYGSRVDGAVRPRAVDQHGVRRHVRLDPRRPGQDPRDGQRAGHPADQGHQEVPRHPEDQPRPRGATRWSPWARRGSARSTWPTPTRRSPTAACAPTCT